MIIGMPKEIKNNEYRVAIVPSAAMELTRRGHQVLLRLEQVSVPASPTKNTPMQVRSLPMRIRFTKRPKWYIR